jgi:hypothetical protein
MRSKSRRSISIGYFQNWKRSSPIWDSIYLMSTVPSPLEKIDIQPEFQRQWDLQRGNWNKKTDKATKPTELKDDELVALCKELKSSNNGQFIKHTPLETLISALDAMWDFDEDEDIKVANARKKRGHRDYLL